MIWKPWISRLSPLLLLLPNLASAQNLRVATWNIENFWHVPGVPLWESSQDRQTGREKADYRAIRALIADLDADIWALQEIGSPEAARSLFPDDLWTLVFSSRYSPDVDRDIYTALALSKAQVELIDQATIPLRLDGRHRDGTAARVRVGGETFWVASIHLKARCQFDPPARPAGSDACQIMAQQLEILETWMDRHLDQGLFLMGDFNRTFMGDRRRDPDGLGPAWQDLNDGDPEPIFAFPFAPEVNCPETRFGDRTWPIDFVVTNATWALRAQPGPYMQPMGGQALSDHCPVVVAFQLP